MERMPESQVLLDIAAEDDEFAQAMDRAFRKVSRQINVPGFRKGHAPRFIIEQMYGREVFLSEAQQDLMDKLYREALQQEELVPVGTPDVELVEMEPLNFKVTVSVYPEIEPGNYKDVRVEPTDASIDPNAVDEVLGRIQKMQSPWVDPSEERSPREGDQITIDLAVKDGDEEFEKPAEDAVFVLGESNLFDQLRAEIEKLKVGETVTTDVKFDEDDEEVSERVRGKTLTYTITLKGLKERELMPLDDDLAQTVNESSLDQLKKEIQNDLHVTKTNEARTEVVNEIINKMAEGATIELPEPMIDDVVNEDYNNFRMRLTQQGQSLEEYQRLADKDETEMKEEMRPSSERRLRNSLLLREIANREGVEISDADLDAEIESLVVASPDAERARELYREGGYFRRMLQNDLFDRRLTDRLIEIATESRGAVINGWTAESAEGESEGESEGEEEQKPKATAAKKTSKAKKEDEDGEAQVAAEGTEADAEAEAASES
jgi:trigger factor